MTELAIPYLVWALVVPGPHGERPTQPLLYDRSKAVCVRTAHGYANGAYCFPMHAVIGRLHQGDPS